MVSANPGARWHPAGVRRGGAIGIPSDSQPLDWSPSSTLAVRNVPRDITPKDRIMQASGYTLAGLLRDDGFEAQVATIRPVQDAVLSATPEERGHRQGRTREPKELYEARYAQCGDRSRAIGKAIRLIGFETRYVFLLEVVCTGSALAPLVHRRCGLMPSWRVQTSQGWMIVESVSRWVWLDAAGEPISPGRVAAPERSRRPISAPKRTLHLRLRPVLAAREVLSPVQPDPGRHWGELLVQ
jgi:hypothetical protein